MFDITQQKEVKLTLYTAYNIHQKHTVVTQTTIEKIQPCSKTSNNIVQQNKKHKNITV